MLYDIKIDFAGASGSSDIQDVGTQGFSVTNYATILTTANPRLLPTSGLFNGLSSTLEIQNSGYQIYSDAFRIEVWFYFPNVAMDGDIVNLPGDMVINTDGTNLTFQSVMGGYTEVIGVDDEAWNKLIILRVADGADMRITGILNGYVWFSRIDNSLYTSEITYLGSNQVSSQFFEGQVALFYLQTSTDGMNPSGRDEPPRTSVILSKGSTEQVIHGAYIGEAPYLVKSPLDALPGDTSPRPYAEWDLLPDFSAGLDIPRVRVHARGAPFEYGNGMGLTANNDPPSIWLSWEGGLQSHEWMNYDPHYFLFYRGNKKFGTYDASKKRGRFSGWIHPSHTGTISGTGKMFRNFSVGEANFTNYTVDYRASEWAVPLQRFSKLEISSLQGTDRFNPWSYYKAFSPAEFPVLSSTWSNYHAPIGKRRKSSGSQVAYNLGIKGCLYLKFCIVIRDPLKPQRPIFGPMSESVMIYPRVGEFDDGIGDAVRHYYAWGASIRS